MTSAVRQALPSRVRAQPFGEHAGGGHQHDNAGTELTLGDCEGKGDHRIAAVLSPASFQAGVDEFGRDFAEQLIVQHYTTDGIFEDEVRVGDDSETRWVARSGASGGEVTVWFVARDDRGGVTWAERRARVR